MASLTVTLTEALTLNGVDQGGSSTLTVTGINDLYKRIVTCPASTNTTLLGFNSTVAINNGVVDMELAKYIRITNLDSSDDLSLNLQIVAAENDTAADENAAILVEAGHSFMMGTPSDGIAIYSGSTILAATDLHNLESIVVNPGSNAIVVEVFIASA